MFKLLLLRYRDFSNYHQLARWQKRPSPYQPTSTFPSHDEACGRPMKYVNISTIDSKLACCYMPCLRISCACSLREAAKLLASCVECFWWQSGKQQLLP